MRLQDCVNVLALNWVVLGFNHVLFIFFTRVIFISRELVNLLTSNGVVLGFIHVLFIFFASSKKTNQKKRAPCLGIFCLIRQKPLCQLRVAIAPVLRSFPQLFWTKGILNSCNPSGMSNLSLLFILFSLVSPLSNANCYCPLFFWFPLS